MSDSITLADFWRQLSYVVFETYSFNRGPNSAESREQLNRQIAAARQALQAARYMQLNKLSSRLRQLEEELAGSANDVQLTDPTKASPYSTSLLSILPAHSDSILASVFQQATGQEAFAGCTPIFRDALVFYDAKGQQVGVLNICFQCAAMRANSNQVVEADFATYNALRQFLVELGHPIETSYYPETEH